MTPPRLGAGIEPRPAPARGEPRRHGGRAAPLPYPGDREPLGDGTTTLNLADGARPTSTSVIVDDRAWRTRAGDNGADGGGSDDR